MNIIDILNYSFIDRALIAGSFVAILCSVLGLFLVLRKMSLIGDGLAHVSFGAIALGLFFGVYPFYIAIPTAIAGSYLILKITEKAKVYGDAAIGIVSAVGVSSGVIIASVSGGFNTDLFSYLFGNILAISNTEVYLSVILAAIVLAVIYFFYQELFSVTFDEEYAKATGIKTKRANMILATLTAVSVVLSVRIVGVMLISALLILPAVTALQIAKSFRSAIICSAIFSVISVISGIIISFFLNLPAGAMIVMMNFLMFVITFLIKTVSYK